MSEPLPAGLVFVGALALVPPLLVGMTVAPRLTTLVLLVLGVSGWAGFIFTGRGLWLHIGLVCGGLAIVLPFAEVAGLLPFSGGLR